MRILVYGLNFYPELTGIGKYTGEMAQYLAEQGHEIQVITTPPYYPYWEVQKPYKPLEYKKETWQGTLIYRCPLWVPKKQSGIKRLLHLASFAMSSLPTLLMQVRWKPDLVFCIAPALANAPFGMLFGRFIGAKTWLHIQDFEVDAALNLGLLPKKLHLPALSIEKKLLTEFDRISTISRSMLSRLLDKGQDASNLFLFPNWIDTEQIFPIKVSPLREEWAIGNDTIVVLYSGNMGIKQGLGILIDTAKLLSNEADILFVLCGEGGVKADLEEAAQVLPNIRFYPLQPLERLNDLLNLADIHVLPQRADAADLVMPSKLSGILASGKVVIATASSGSELGTVVSKVGVLVPPENEQELADAILKLAEKPGHRNDLGKKGREWVLANWGKEKILGTFEKDLKGVLES